MQYPALSPEEIALRDANMQSPGFDPEDPTTWPVMPMKRPTRFRGRSID